MIRDLTTMTIRFSIIIPAYNEEKFLPRLLDSIHVARENYSGDAVEIIVADNASTDRTNEVAENLGARVVRVEKRCIAAARNGGAAMAGGEVFCFVDADSAIHPDTFSRIDAAMSDRRYVVGATGVYLERFSPGLLSAYLLIKPFTWLLQMDTGVVFCRREDFAEVGGYNENLLLSEDVAFLKALKKLGRPTGRRFVRLKNVEALGSTRKFDEHGDWHYFALMAGSFKYMLKSGFKVFSQHEAIPEITKYWYRPNR